MNRTVGVLLAGGLSRRFGSPKAFAELDGKPFYEYALKALEAASDQVVVISRPELVARFPKELDVITDLEHFEGLGPLAGIMTAMSERPADQYLVLPCDMPFVGAAEAEALRKSAKNSYDVTALRNQEEAIPLFSIWNVRIKDELEAELRSGQLRVMEFMGKVHTEWLDSAAIHGDPAIFRNLNKPEQGKGGDEHGHHTSAGPL